MEIILILILTGALCGFAAGGLRRKLALKKAGLNADFHTVGPTAGFGKTGGNKPANKNRGRDGNVYLNSVNTPEKNLKAVITALNVENYGTDTPQLEVK